MLLNPYRFAVAAGGPTAVVSEVTVSNAANQTSYATASYTPPSNTLLIAFVANVGSTGGNNVAPTLSGNGLTWDAISNRSVGTYTRLTTFRAAGSATAGALTASFGGLAQGGCIIRVVSITGAAFGSNGADGITQITSAGNVASADPSVTLVSPPTSNHIVLGMEADDVGDSTSRTLEAGWTQLAQTSNADMGAISYYQLNATDQSASITATSRRWGMVILEVQ